MSYENKITLNASALPVKTWNWLHVNDTRIQIPDGMEQKGKIAIDALPSNSGISIYTKEELEQQKQSVIMEKTAEMTGAIGSEWADWLKKQNTAEAYIVIDSRAEKNDEQNQEVQQIQNDEQNWNDQQNGNDQQEKQVASQRVHISYEAKDGDLSTQILTFYVREGGQAEVVFESASAKDAKGMQSLLIRCYLEPKAKLSIYQSQMLGEGFQFISDITAVQEAESQLSIVRANLGGNEVYLGMKSDLVGSRAELHSSLAYLSRKKQKVDINDIVLHKGKKTICDLNSQGVLLGEAEKTYKGTIDLQHGCAGAKGQELETVLLLSDDVINKTVPLILCGEEDVEGNHGASIGKIDEETLYYMQSRGIDPEQARLLIVNGRLNQVIQMIPEPAVTDRAVSFIKEVFDHEYR